MSRKFNIDKQTLEDLNLLGKYKNNSIYSLFNHTVTRGGEIALERMFINPLIDASEINGRRDLFAFFQTKGYQFPLQKEEFDIAERYLTNGDSKTLLGSLFNNFKRKAMKLIANDEEYGILQEGMLSALSACGKLERFMQEIHDLPGSNPYKEVAKKALKTLQDKNLKLIYTSDDNKVGFLKFSVCDHKLRYTLSESLLELLSAIYDLDVYIAVTEVGRKRGFSYANALEDKVMKVEMRGVYHPCVSNAVANDIQLDQNSNVLFLTGANMAGKSTLMKAFGVTLYLAHMGFPIPVASMSFSMLDGIYTSINVPDNLNMGYSHFYAEVKRVKDIALEVSSGKNLMVMFDELFKGTNVKDAYDATVAVTEAFSGIHECAFIVSTHIMEAGATLQQRCRNMKFKYLPTVLKGSMPVYTYVLDDGISNDRHGMMIINNEKILEIIRRTIE